MEEVIYKSLQRYFTRLKQVGYQNYNTVNKIIAIIAIQKMLEDEHMALMFSDCDLRTIEKVLYKLYGSECIIPFPYNGNISKEQPEKYPDIIPVETPIPSKVIMLH